MVKLRHCKKIARAIKDSGIIIDNELYWDKFTKDVIFNLEKK